MKFKSINPTTTEAWKKLTTHFSEIKDVHMMDIFDQEPDKMNNIKLNGMKLNSIILRIE